MSGNAPIIIRVSGVRVPPPASEKPCVAGLLSSLDVRRDANFGPNFVLPHRFGTQVIGNPRVSILQLKEWMGHADIDTTMKYRHFAPRAGDRTWSPKRSRVALLRRPTPPCSR